jgi:pyruvate kinase
MQFQLAKIVATLGPASASPETVRRILLAGADVLRLNFSHGTFAEQGERIAEVRRIAQELRRPLGILQDLPGPKVRLGEVAGGKMLLATGAEVTLGPAGSAADLPVELAGLATLLVAGDRVLLADGTIEIEVLGTAGDLVRCRVLGGGTISSRKGITLPSLRWRPEVPTEADREAILFGLERKVDFIALSYVGSAEEIRTARSFIVSHGGSAAVIAKIETRRALDNLEAIVEAADGVMVARGDLGVEMPPEDVPPAQRRIVALARRLGKPVIVATQMLGSMTQSSRPTRAETADVAGAVWSGADAVMLSDETAAGLHPVEAVEVMARIIGAAARDPFFDTLDPAARGPAEAVAHAACRLATEIGAAAIVAATESGFTAQTVARFRPPCPIVGLTPNAGTANRLCLLWGVQPFLGEHYDDLDDMSRKAAEAARALGLAAPGALLVCTAGFPFTRRGGTDLVRVITA